MSDVINTGILDSMNPNDPNSIIYDGVTGTNELGIGSSGNTDNLPGGYYYSEYGEFLGKEGKSQNVYLADEKIVEDVYDKNNKKTGERNKYTNQRTLNINHSALINKSATVFAEGSYSYNYKNEKELIKEALVIAAIHYNYPKIKAYGETAPEAQRFKKISEEKRNNTHYQYYIASIIQAVLKLDISEGCTHWDGIDILCGRGSYGWDATKHQKQKPEGKYKGISDPNGLANDFYNKWKTHLEYMLSLPNLNKSIRADYEAKYKHLKPLEVYKPEYDDKKKLKYQPLYEIRATYALTLFYKKVNFK